jgi:CRISPR-associated protein Cas1
MQLVINSPGTFITQKNECFRLKQKEKVFDVSPLKVESIVISNQAMISTQAVVLALEHNIDVIFLDSFGDPLGRIWFSKMGSTALIRRKQLEAAEKPTIFLSYYTFMMEICGGAACQFWCGFFMTS